MFHQGQETKQDQYLVVSQQYFISQPAINVNYTQTNPIYNIYFGFITTRIAHKCASFVFHVVFLLLYKVKLVLKIVTAHHLRRWKKMVVATYVLVTYTPFHFSSLRNLLHPHFKEFHNFLFSITPNKQSIWLTITLNQIRSDSSTYLT